MPTRRRAPTRADAVVTFVFKRAPVPSFDTTDGSTQESLVIGNYGCLAVPTPSSSLSGAPRFVSSSATTSPATATTRRETKSTPTARALVSSPARLAFTLAFASVHSNRRPVAANFSSLESPPRAQSPPRGDDDVPRRRREVDARAPTLDRAIATATTMGTTTRAFVQPRARRRRRREKTPRGRRRN